MVHAGTVHTGMIHGHATVIHIHHRVVHADHRIRRLHSWQFSIGTQGRVDQVSARFRGIHAGAAGVIVEEEKGRADDGEDAECPGTPKAIEGAECAKILDDRDRDE